MKKHLIIGNPISHSLSPKVHNFWLRANGIDGNYDKILLSENEINTTIQRVKNNEIHGMNVTVPFKQTVIPFLETLSEISIKTNSVNTIFNKEGKIHGDNTDVYGFEKSILNNKIDLEKKSALIFGAGGVVPSIITALKNLRVQKIYISNRTIENANLILLSMSWTDNNFENLTQLKESGKYDHFFKKLIIIGSKKNKSVAVSDNLHYAGYHLKKHYEYFVNSLLWSLAGAYLLIESAESDLPPTLGIICYLGSFYNIWKMAQSIDKAGKQLSEASKTMELNEKNNRK